MSRKLCGKLGEGEFGGLFEIDVIAVFAERLAEERLAAFPGDDGELDREGPAAMLDEAAMGSVEGTVHGNVLWLQGLADLALEADRAREEDGAIAAGGCRAPERRRRRGAVRERGERDRPFERTAQLGREIGLELETRDRDPGAELRCGNLVTMISAKEPAGNGETPGRLTRISTGPLERQEAPAAVARASAARTAKPRVFTVSSRGPTPAGP